MGGGNAAARPEQPVQAAPVQVNRTRGQNAVLVESRAAAQPRVAGQPSAPAQPGAVIHRSYIAK